MSPAAREDRAVPRKVVLIADPGIDTAFAVALALADPALDVVGLLPTAGNVSAAQATTNVHTLISHLDPRKWPRTAAAVAVEFPLDGTALHGPDGLGGVGLPTADRRDQPPADRVLCELAHEHPRELTVICLGPATTVARAFDRDPALPSLLDRLVLVGGCWKEPGNSGPVSEFHFVLDPDAARRCLRSGSMPTVVPLDVTRRLVLSPSELLELPNADSRTCRLLRQIAPPGIRASSHLYGVEGLHLKDVLGVLAVSLPGCVTTEEHPADVETRGDLTRGMLVVDARPGGGARPTCQLGVGAAVGEVRQHIHRVLSMAP